MHSFLLFDSVSPYRGRNSLHSACAACAQATIANIEAAIAHTASIASYIDATVHIEAVTSHTAPVTAHIDASTAHTATKTAHTVPVSIKPPFEPTATAHKK